MATRITLYKNHYFNSLTFGVFFLVDLGISITILYTVQSIANSVILLNSCPLIELLYYKCYF